MPSSYGLLIIGPPGSGKSTFCKSMGDYMRKFNRRVVTVNLDPANDVLPYDAGVDVSELITVTDVMKHKKLGPNGGLLYAMEYVEQNFTWLREQLAKHASSYFIFDFPGQIELYTHHDSTRNIAQKLQKSGFNLCSVYLVDSHYCNDPGKFISALLITLSTMLHLEMPHVNILSKVDMMKKFDDKLPFSLEYYTEVLDLNFILEYLQEDKFTARYRKLNSSIVELLEGYSLVSFLPLSVNDDRMLLQVKKHIDKANGYVYNAGEETSVQALLACAVGAEPDTDRFGINRDLFSTDEGSVSMSVDE